MLAGCALRVGLAVVNQQANDDHLIVSTWIRDSQWLIPDSRVCWECYHAKAYHYAAALIFEFLSLDDTRYQVLAANLLNVAAGVLWLLLIKRFLERSTTSRLSYLATLAFFALCPAFITIQSQATNDAFVILFSTGMIYCLWRFLQQPTLSKGICFTLCAVLAASSKVSGWIGFFTALLVIFVYIVDRMRHRGTDWHHAALLALISALVFFGTVPFEPPYAEYIRDFGTPLTSPQTREERQAPAKLFEETPTLRPGVRWIAEAFGTFRLLGMIETPYISNDQHPFPEHRTSFWSQLYGRMSFSRFDQWPSQWQGLDGTTIAVGRIAIVVGLLPAAAALLGLVIACSNAAHGLLGRSRASVDPSLDWVLLAFFAAFFCVLIKVTLDGRQFSWMKPIYMFPGSLGICLIYLRGIEAAARRNERLVLSAAVVSGLVYVIDVSWLVYQLFRR